MIASRIAPALLAAYRQADYQVNLAEDGFIFNVDKRSPALDALHRQYRAQCSVFITACNPSGNAVTEDTNVMANQALQQALLATGCTVIPCTGVDPEGQWPDEPGFLAIGLACDTGRQLGTLYRQNAILCSGEDAVPRLVMLQ